MASIYRRGNKYWITYKGADGKWHQRSTGFPANKLREAKRMAALQTQRESVLGPVNSANWEWVPGWMASRWGDSRTSTPERYRVRWQFLQQWLRESEIAGPRNVTRELCLNYPAWRAQRHGRRNVAIDDLKLLAMALDEAIQREYCDRNPARKLGLKRDPRQEKRPWTPEELDLVDRTLAEREPYGWMRCTYLLGRYQSMRLRGCQVPLDCIDLQAGVIRYSANIMKGRRELIQPIDLRLQPLLTDIVAHRLSAGHMTLCDVPQMASVDWHNFLWSLGITGISHHSLRVTWISEAARKGIPESMAMRFSGHSSTLVHRLYAKFSPSDLAEVLKRLA
jgi:hypothetical protein